MNEVYYCLDEIHRLEFGIRIIIKAEKEDKDVRYPVEDSFQHLVQQWQNLSEINSPYKLLGFTNVDLVYIAHEFCLNQLCCVECRSKYRSKNMKRRKRRKRRYTDFDDTLLDVLSTTFIPQGFHEVPKPTHI